MILNKCIQENSQSEKEVAVSSEVVEFSPNILKIKEGYFKMKKYK